MVLKPVEWFLNQCHALVSSVTVKTMTHVHHDYITFSWFKIFILLLLFRTLSCAKIRNNETGLITIRLVSKPFFEILFINIIFFHLDEVTIPSNKSNAPAAEKTAETVFDTFGKQSEEEEFVQPKPKRTRGPPKKKGNNLIYLKRL